MTQFSCKRLLFLLYFSLSIEKLNTGFFSTKYYCQVCCPQKFTRSTKDTRVDERGNLSNNREQPIARKHNPKDKQRKNLMQLLLFQFLVSRVNNIVSIEWNEYNVNFLLHSKCLSSFLSLLRCDGQVRLLLLLFIDILFRS